MKNNPYKAFIPYKIHRRDPAQQGSGVESADYASCEAFDPEGSEWEGHGFVKPDGESFTVTTNAVYLLHVQFNERSLPAKVINERVEAIVRELEATEGVKVAKKARQQIREEVEQDLLPKAFIKRTVIPVIIDWNANLVFVYTSSESRADAIVGLLYSPLGEQFLLIERVSIPNLTAGLSNLEAIDEDRYFTVGTSAVFRFDDGDEKKTVRVKDVDLFGKDMAELRKSGYSVTDLALTYGLEGEPMFEFKLNDKGVFRSLKLTDAEMENVDRDDEYAELRTYAWMIFRNCVLALNDLLRYMGKDEL